MDKTTHTTATNSNPEMVFTMGLPAAGKSTVAVERFGDTHTMIDPDAIKESHPDYNPARPQDLHQWSQEVAEQMFAAAVESGDGRWVVDGTGTNAEKMVRRIKQSKAAGFTVRLVYVVCSLQTSIARNAARPRVVPVDVIIGKARDIATAFEIVAPFADTVETIDNN